MVGFFRMGTSVRDVDVGDDAPAVADVQDHVVDQGRHGDKFVGINGDESVREEGGEVVIVEGDDIIG